MPWALTNVARVKLPACERIYGIQAEQVGIFLQVYWFLSDRTASICANKIHTKVFDGELKFETQF